MTLDSRRVATGRHLATLSLCLLCALSLQLRVLLGGCFGGFASLDLIGLFSALASQTGGCDKSLDLRGLIFKVSER
jgi:hypothetical protein